MNKLFRETLQSRPVRVVYRRPILHRRGRPPSMSEEREHLPPEKTSPLPINQTTALSSSIYECLRQSPPTLLFDKKTAYDHQSTTSLDSATLMPSRKLFKELVSAEAIKLQTYSVPPNASSNFESGLVATKEMQIDCLLRAFRDGTSKVIATTDILNEAVYSYLKMGLTHKADKLIKQYPSLYGVRSNNQTTELMAMLEWKAGNFEKSRHLLISLSTITAYGQEIFYEMIKSTLRQRKDDISAWNLFDDLRSKALPAQHTTSLMLHRCGELENPEKAFLTFEQVTKQGMIPNIPCMVSLIYAASKRKEYYSKAMEIHRQMELLNMPIPLPVYNHLLYACGKVADLGTALKLWKKLTTSEDAARQANQYTICNFLWVLASVETMHTKLSRRAFVYELDRDELDKTVMEVLKFIDERQIPRTAHLMNALLGFYSNNWKQKQAEELFWQTLPATGIARTPFTFELMFKLYDNVKNYEGACQIYNHLKEEKVSLPYEGWRALIRSAALSDHYEAALEHLREAIQQGYKFHLKDLKAVHFRILQSGREDLGRVLLDLVEKDGDPVNKHLPWLQRSQAISKLLANTYGKQAPKCATHIATKKKIE